MSTNTTRAFNQGLCPAPFRQENLFKDNGGFIEGRFCSSTLGLSCCLPCPSTDWLYPDTFDTWTNAANWINVASMVCCAFMLISWAVLPASQTGRHYLSICLVGAVVLMNLGFMVPLAARPEQCFDDITPNSMKTSHVCGASGALLLFGGFAGVMWVMMRAVALHLQICWQMVIGNAFMWGALSAGWAIPAIMLTTALVFSGVSFRFGETCHINHKNSMASFWIPILVFAGITLIVQFATFGYCIKVYLASLGDDSTTTDHSGLPSYAPSSRATVSPRQAYRRVRRVIELQWKGISIVLLIVADVIFFAVVFVYMDNIETNMVREPAKARAWLICLIQNRGDKNQCLDAAAPLIINIATVMAVLILLSMNGIWCMVFLGRWTMIVGWKEFIRSKFNKDTEFISADVSKRTLFKDPGSGTYEMLSRDRDVALSPDVPKPVGGIAGFTASAPITPLSPAAQTAPTGKNGRETPDYFGREARYKSPTRSFSSPKAPQGILKGWDSHASHAAPGQSAQQREPNQYYTGMDPLSMNRI